MQREKNRHATAIFIGFFLILLIAAATIIRPYFYKKSDPATIAPAGNTDGSSTKNPNQLDSADLLAKINSGSGLSLIDTRTETDFLREHVTDSKNIPLENIEAALPALSKDRIYVIVDDGSQGGLSVALNLFPQNGFKNTFYLNGGFPAWKLAGNPIVSAGDPNSFSDQAKVHYINSDGLKNSLATESNLLLVDLRSRENFAQGHIPGAINIFLDDLEARRSELPFGRKIVLYDRDGLWAFQGAVRLFDLGIFNVFSLSDGLDAWKQKNYPLEK